MEGRLVRLRGDVVISSPYCFRRRLLPRIKAVDDETNREASATKNDLLERIAKAKAYKAKREETEVALPVVEGVFGDELVRPEESDRRLTNEDFRARFNRGTADGPVAFREAMEVEEDIIQQTQFSGDASQKASFIPQDDVTVIAPDVRPEDFTIEQEERRKERGADVVSVDKSYRPKVSTWGVFPRPVNISETYGGGRAIDPNQPLESKDEKEKREKEVAAALLEYRRRRGMDIDPEIENAFAAKFKEAETIMRNGRLTAAAQMFDDAARMVPFKSKYGGEAILKKAICLDSIGNTKQAKALYEQLVKSISLTIFEFLTLIARHPQTDISKQARRMLFGFKAMNHLKVAKMKKTDLASEYMDYFARLPQDWNSLYLAREDEELEGFDDSLKLALMMSGCMLIMPLILILALSFA